MDQISLFLQTNPWVVLVLALVTIWPLVRWIFKALWDLTKWFSTKVSHDDISVDIAEYNSSYLIVNLLYSLALFIIFFTITDIMKTAISWSDILESDLLAEIAKRVVGTVGLLSILAQLIIVSQTVRFVERLRNQIRQKYVVPERDKIKVLGQEDSAP